MSAIALRLPIVARAGLEQAVDARNLHGWLEVGRDFSNWLKTRIAELGFTEGVDYEKLNDSASPNLASANRVDYALSLDAAKHLALVERNDRGRQARAYFIEAEKRARNPLALLSDPATLRGLLGDYAARVEQAEAKIAADAPKVAFHDRVLDTADLVGIREAAKVLRVNERELVHHLIDKGYAQRLGGRLAVTYVGQIARGYVDQKESEWSDPSGTVHAKPRLFLTQKGMRHLHDTLAVKA